MTGSWNDFNDAESQTSYDLIPKGTIVPVRMTIKPGGFDDPSQGWTGGYATRSGPRARSISTPSSSSRRPLCQAQGLELDRAVEPQGPGVGQHGPLLRARHPELRPRLI